MDGVFELRIDLGNDAMRSARDVAEALRNVAERIEDGEWHRSIRDVNGNTVGRYAIDTEGR